MRALLTIACILILSCGRQKSKDDQTQSEVVYIDGSNIQGVYQTPLRALNFNTPLGVIGSAGLHRSSDTFKAYVKLYIGNQGVAHRQSVHLGDRCPTIQDDINGDGYIDQREAFFVVGKIIMPLDGDLDSQAGGSNTYPRGNGMAGGYFYERSASFSRMFEDLRDTDDNTQDEVDKIPYNQGISFNNKVILIHGVSSSTMLPMSVDVIGNLGKHQSIPIACGVLKASQNFPSELYDRSDPITTHRPLRRPVIIPRVEEHREPEIVITPPPPYRPPPRRSIGSRVRDWFRNTFGNDEEDGEN